VTGLSPPSADTFTADLCALETLRGFEATTAAPRNATLRDAPPTAGPAATEEDAHCTGTVAPTTTPVHAAAMAGKVRGGQRPNCSKHNDNGAMGRDSNYNKLREM